MTLIRSYRLVLSPLLTAIFTPFGFGCRFTPTCSQYALEAVQKLGPWRGSLLAARRICRCHPWGGSGYDPVSARFPIRASVLECGASAPLSIAPTEQGLPQGVAWEALNRNTEPTAIRKS